MAQNSDVHKKKEALVLLTKRFQKILEKEKTLTHEIVERSVDRQQMLKRIIEDVHKLLQKQRALNEHYSQELLGLIEINNVLRNSIKDLEEQCRRERFLKYQATNAKIPESESGTEEQRETVAAQAVAGPSQMTSGPSQATTTQEKTDSSQAAGGEEKPKKPSRWKRLIRVFRRKK
ncbi:Hypothetical predicted protein [Scomber scombrus]|uniref:Uncharacterized protein n=1 Tax=Scomber scombrus TaxID=13677 RepID=A0AAV1PVR6_SCOSC